MLSSGCPSEMHQGPVRILAATHRSLGRECSSMSGSRHAQLGLLVDCDGDRAAAGRLLSQLIRLYSPSCTKPQTGRGCFYVNLPQRVSTAHLGLESHKRARWICSTLFRVSRETFFSPQGYGGICIQATALLVVEMLAYPQIACTACC